MIDTDIDTSTYILAISDVFYTLFQNTFLKNEIDNDINFNNKLYPW
jgi:hypothetical protein